MDRGIFKIKNWFDREKFTFLLFSLVLYTVAVPFFDSIFPRGMFIQLSFLVVLITSIFAVSSKRNHLLLISVLVGLSVMIFCLKFFEDSKNILIVESIIAAIFYGCMVYIITGHSYRCEDISRDTISAALIGYIILGLLWSNIYILIELLYPNSFNLAHEAIIDDPSLMRYFSLVTITTLGYGDISPVSTQARHIAITQAFVGQMYIAVLVARLVALQTSQALKK